MRPTLGAWMTVTHTLVRVQLDYGKRLWAHRSGLEGRDYDDGFRGPVDYSQHPNLKGIQPFKAMYIGFRTLCNGVTESEDGWKFFIFGERIEGYLLVYGERNKPILALPEHCFMMVKS